MTRVALWLDHVDAAAAAARAGGLAWLTEAERARLAGLAAPRRRAQFVAGRWVARALLSAVHGGDPATEWPLSAGDDGPPRALRPEVRERVCVAISHSGNLVACAVASEPVGIDIEVAGRNRDVPTLAQAVGTPGERARLAIEPGPGQRQFLVMWTLKEAWFKRRHEGVTPGRLAGVETRPADGPAEGRVWQHDDMTLALLAEADASVHWHHDALGIAGEPGAAWHVTPV